MRCNMVQLFIEIRNIVYFCAYLENQDYGYRRKRDKGS